jgi:cytochrome c oxidase subunit 2
LPAPACGKIDSLRIAMKNRHILPLAAIMLVVGIITFGVIFLIPWLPTAASVEAGRTDQLIWFETIVSGVIFTIVCSFVVYSAWAFRAAPGDESDGPPTHGNTKLEIVWTAIPVVIVAIIAGWSVIVVNRNENTQKVQEVVHVKAWQYAWEFDYPSLGISSGDLHVIDGTQTKLNINSFDVIHGFWVPQFRLQMDAVPGITTHLLFTPNKLGTWYVICNELCGEGHAQMRARVIIQSQAQFNAWAAQAQAQAKAAAAAASSSSAAVAP